MPYPFLLPSICKPPKNSLFESLRQGTYTGLRSAFLFFAHHLISTGIFSSSFQTSTAPSMTFPVTLCFLPNSSAFFYSFVQPPCVVEVSAKLSVNINPDTSSCVTLSPCFGASIAIIKSSVKTLSKVCDNVHLYATLCQRS